MSLKRGASELTVPENKRVLVHREFRVFSQISVWKCFVIAAIDYIKLNCTPDQIDLVTCLMEQKRSREITTTVFMQRLDAILKSGGDRGEFGQNCQADVIKCNLPLRYTSSVLPADSTDPRCTICENNACDVFLDCCGKTSACADCLIRWVEKSNLARPTCMFCHKNMTAVQRAFF